MAVCLIARGMVAAVLAAAAAAPDPPRSPGEAEPFVFSTEVTPEEVPFGGEVRYAITVRHPRVDTYSLPADLDLGAFRLAGAAKARRDQGDEATTTLELRLEVLDVGEKAIADVALLVEGPSGPRRLVVPGPKVKSVSSLPEDAAMRDIKGPAVVAVASYALLVALAAVAGALLFGLILWRVLARRAHAILAAPPEPAHLRALRELAALRALDLPGKGRTKQLYLRLSEIVRRYLGERFAFNAIDLTTPELLAALRRLEAVGLDYGGFEAFCREADLVKFARLEPTDAECVGALDAARSFVERTVAVEAAVAVARAA